MQASQCLHIIISTNKGVHNASFAMLAHNYNYGYECPQHEFNGFFEQYGKPVQTGTQARSSANTTAQKSSGHL